MLTSFSLNDELLFIEAVVINLSSKRFDGVRKAYFSVSARSCWNLKVNYSKRPSITQNQKCPSITQNRKRPSTVSSVPTLKPLLFQHSLHRFIAYGRPHSAVPIKVPPGTDRPCRPPFSYATGHPCIVQMWTADKNVYFVFHFLRLACTTIQCGKAK